MRNQEKIFWHAFNNIIGFGPQKFKLLLAKFPDLETAWKASRQDISSSGIGEKLAEKFFSEREKLDPETLFSDLAKEKIEIATIRDDAYPPQLKEISSAPPVIYVRGNTAALKNKSLALVGSRKFTAYGERVAQSLVRELVPAGLTIVSGLALGIDAICHRATLKCEGTTVAVLGNGLDDDSIFPRDNFNLAKNIIESGGALVGEYPPRMPSLKQNFPARNRIMAGLTLGTLVIEAAEGSGSLITARDALEFNREVFAVPGPLFAPQSAGANWLIKNGAKLVSSATDILEELNISHAAADRSQKVFEPVTSEEKLIWKNLGSDPLHIDKLAKLTKLNPATVNSVLSMLEIQGAVKNIGGQNFIKL